MLSYRYGGKQGRTYSLVESPHHLVVRTVNRSPLDVVRVIGGPSISRRGREALEPFEMLFDFADFGVQVFQVRPGRRGRSLRDRARAALKREPQVQFAGRVLVDRRSRQPVVYTENLFVKFDDDRRPSQCKTLLRRVGLEPRRELGYTRNAYFVSAPEGVGQKVFPTALRLLKDPAVELCHPEIVRQRRLRAAFPPQWHLKATRVDGVLVNAHANVEAAWPVAQGEGIVIAVIDDGVDVQHEEFRSSGKIVAPRDVTRGTDDPAPKTLRDRHGHACAGVACADGRFGASGVAPRARLMPIRLASQLGSQSEADAFAWAADHGADVISCSWGPADGDPNDPHDPAHQEIVRLPDSTRLAIDYAATNGRDGKGCVVLFAAGNGNESVDNDGYASYRNVIAVAACSDQGTHSWYSDFGRAVWCAFPSNDGDTSVTPGIWTTDRPGATGYNPGDERRGDAAGNYTNSFGGTSSACPGAAGVAALALSRNPALRRDEVREILRLASDQIDKTHGQYDASGRSPFYGYGRLNAARAVELALPSQPTPVVTRTIQQDVAIKDLSTASLRLGVADAQPLVSIKVTVVIDHTYIGDLVVRLKPPTATAVPAIVLHNRTGGGTRNLRKTFDVVNVPGLAACVGKSPAGTWTLRIADMERLDTGTLRSFTLEFGF